MIRKLLVVALLSLVLVLAPVDAATVRGVATFEESVSGQADRYHRLLQETAPGTL